MKKFNTVVIGAGPGGYVAAIRLAQLGVQTAIVDRGSLGGVCLNWGCIPSKAYITAAKVVDHIEKAAEIGITAGDPKVDLAKMKEWKDGIVTRLTGGVQALLEKAGVEILQGEACFKGPNTLSITQDGETTDLGFQNALVATGSRSIEIPGFKYDGEDIISSRHALDLTEVPKDLVVIGGGVIGLEIGMYLARFGSNVTIVEMLDHVLPGVDAEVVKLLVRTLKKRKIKVMTSCKALGYSGSGGSLSVSVEDKAGKKKEIPASKVLVAVGRRPNTENLGLETAGVTMNDGGLIQVNASRQTTCPSVWAIGDCTEGPQLAHKASKEGLVAAGAIAGGSDAWDVRALPWAIFTDPEIAGVGLTEEEAGEQGIQVKVGKFPFSALGRALVMRDTEGFTKIIANAETDEVLGVHIIGPDASDLIAEGALAMEMGATAEDIGMTVHTHPTLAESMMEAAEAVHGKAVHIFNPG